MAELKTKPSDENVVQFLNKLEDPVKRNDCFQLLEMMKEISKSEPKIWGGSIVGFGDYRYKYSTGREGDWFYIGFAPRKDSLSLYLIKGFEDEGVLLEKLGKHKIGKGCLYIKKLTEVDLEILKMLIQNSWTHFQK